MKTLHAPKSRLLLPVNPLFIWGSLLLALLCNLLPLGRAPWVPDFLLLTLLFWCLHQPLRAGLALAFAGGLIMDVHQGVLLGIHALGYSVAAFLVLLLHRRLQWFRPIWQGVQLLLILLLAHSVVWILRMATGGVFAGWALLLAPVIEVALWPLWSMVLLAPQRRALVHDLTRPL